MNDLLRNILNRVLGQNFDAKELATEYAREMLRAELTRRLIRATPGIALRMTLTSSGKDRRGQVREALFLLWKKLVKNGHVADAFRDAQDDKVLAALEGRELDGMRALVEAVAVEIVRVTL